MILANLARAIREQNYYAVFLEFVIVIAGVVIGFQISEWSAMRADAERRAVVLDRLHDEIEDAAGLLQAVLAMYEEVNNDRTEAIERLIAGDFEAMDEPAMIQAVVATSLFPAFSPRQGVYTEIVSSGMLSRLGDKAFRDALGEYQSSVSFLQGQIDYLRDISNSRPRLSETAHVRQEYAPGTERERRYVVDWVAAAEDPDFLQQLLAGHNSMRAIADWWHGTFESALQLCTETGRLTGRTCEPATVNFE
jgi:hypothetical protein